MAEALARPELGVVSTEERRNLYWATSGFDFPETRDRVILPRRWVAASSLFSIVNRALDPDRLAALAGRRDNFDPVPPLEKCVGEAIYERVRVRVLPEAPSRLDCLWAALDMFGAIEFAQNYGPPLQFDPRTRFGNQAAIPVSTADGRWVALDMNLFEIPNEISDDSRANAQAIAQTETTATRYWRGESSATPFVEILAEKLWQNTAFINDGQLPPPYVEWRRTLGQHLTS